MHCGAGSSTGPLTRCHEWAGALEVGAQHQAVFSAMSARRVIRSTVTMSSFFSAILSRILAARLIAFHGPLNEIGYHRVGCRHAPLSGLMVASFQPYSEEEPGAKNAESADAFLRISCERVHSSVYWVMNMRASELERGPVTFQ